MPLTRANHDLVSVAWLKKVTGLTTVSTTVPEDSGSWWSTGLLQPAVIKGETNRYYQLRSCIVVVHCWAARQDVTSQRPPWGQANELAENVAAACYNPSLFQADSLSLGVPGAPSVRVLQAALIEDPMRAPNDDAHMAHYTTTVQLWWVEKILNGGAMHYVRTTMQPHKVICVNDAEYLDLIRSGVVYAEENGDEPLLPQLKADAESATDMKGA